MVGGYLNRFGIRAVMNNQLMTGPRGGEGPVPVALTTIALRNVRVQHGRQTVLNVPDLTLGEHRLTTILGRNGSGKTSLMLAAAGQQEPTAGTICVNGRAMNSWTQNELARRIAFLPQSQPDIQGLRVRELVRLGRFAWKGAFRRHDAQDDKLVDTAMLQCGVAPLADAFAANLSGGERQRAWLAMLLAQDAPLLLLDEPVSALDIEHQLNTMELLKRHSAEKGCSAVVILHDINLACRFSDHVIVMENGEVRFSGSPDELLDEATLGTLFGVPFSLLSQAGAVLPLAIPAQLIR